MTESRQSRDCQVRDDESEALVLAGYAATMEAVQQFELALKNLAVQREDLPEGIDFDTAWNRVEKILRRPMGHLKDALPEGLTTRFPELKRIRNHLAHDMLVRWRFERNLELCDDREVVEGLIEVEREFRELQQQMSAVADQHLRDIGVTDTDMTRSDIREIVLGGEGPRNER
ncbi:MAG TPA: hypothetical protein VF520_01695 [Thermoleophilaceae bacterium]